MCGASHRAPGRRPMAGADDLWSWGGSGREPWLRSGRGARTGLARGRENGPRERRVMRPRRSVSQTDRDYPLPTDQELTWSPKNGPITE